MSENETSTQQKEFVLCKLCNTNLFQQIFVAKDLWEDAHPATKETYTFVQCNNCGLVYLNPRIPAKYIAAYYRDDYQSHSKRPNPDLAHKPTGLRGLLSSKVRHSRQAVFRKLQSQTQPNLGFIERFLFKTAPLTFAGQGLKLLDIGCGTGYELMERQKLGWDVYGLEPDEKAVQICQAYGLKVRQGLLEANSWEKNMFDVITLYQVVEHFSELQENLEQIYQALKPGGLVYITTPNWNSPPARLFRTYWIGAADTPRHYFLFSPKTLAQALSASKLVPKHWYTNSSTSEYTATIEFLLREKFGFKIKRDAIRKNRVLSYLVLPLARSNGWLKVGASIHMFAQKPKL